MHEMFDLTGKTAIVTGGTGSVWNSYFEGLAEAGAVAIILAPQWRRCEGYAKQLQECGLNAVGMSLDLASV